jgi:hypothetical protein
MRAALAVLAALAIGGCGSHCKQLEASRAAFFARRGAPAPGPHVAVAVPFAVLDAQLAAQLEAMPAIALHVPGLPALPLPGGLGDLRLVPRAITLAPGRGEHVAFRIALELDAGDRELIALAATVEAAPHVAHQPHALALGLVPTSFAGAHVELPPDARAALARALDTALPAVVRRVVGPAEREAVAGALVTWLAGETLDHVLGEGVVRRLGELTHLEIELGGAASALPIAALTARSEGAPGTGQVVIEARFDLPIEIPIAEPPAAPSPEVARVRISGAAAAELADWAIATGALPARYHDGKPSPTGELTPGFSWVRGPRPLQIDVWRRTSPCLHARFGAVPVLGMQPDGTLRIELRDTATEQVAANPLVRARMWFFALSFDHAVLAHTRVTLGARTLELRTVAAAADAGGFTFDFRIAPAQRSASGWIERSSLPSSARLPISQPSRE